ncbi:MAG: helix-turn-helix domain-containing protein [Bacteroidales bacterium]|nr:helix-turn-helix domain-containing protein [Bacteroidales bacterium]
MMTFKFRQLPKAISLVLLSVAIVAETDLSAGSRTVSDLPNLTVRSFAQDAKGYMWIATDNGLCRFSGHDYLHFYNEPETEGSLPSDKVRSLAMDGNGVLWVLTDKGLCWYDNMGDVFVSVPLDFQPDGIIHNEGSIICYGAEGMIAVNPVTCSILNTYRDSLHQVSVLVADSCGNLWGGLKDGSRAAGYDSRGGFRCTVDMPSVSGFRSAALDSRGSVWFGRNRGAFVLDPVAMSQDTSAVLRNCLDRIAGSSVTTLLAVGSTMYICMPATGIYTLGVTDGLFKTDAVDRFGLSQMSDFCCGYCDSENHPWIGTMDRGFGVRFLEKRNFSLSRNLSKQTLGKYINSVAVSKKTGYAWMASYYKGIMSFGMAHFRVVWHNYGKDPGLNAIGQRGIKSIMCDSMDRLWINMEGNVAVCETSSGRLKSGKIVCSGMEVNSFLEDGNGCIWLCTDNGLSALSGGKVERALFKGYKVNDAVRFGDGHILVAVDNYGLCEVDVTTGSAEMMPLENEDLRTLLKNPSCLYSTGGKIWAGTRSKGLMVIEDGKLISRYTTNNGLGSNDISGIIDDGAGNVYVSTSYGLSIITSKFPVAVTYYQGRWMDTQQFCPGSVAGVGGKIFFGGNTGVAYLDSPRIISNISEEPVKVVFTELTVNGDIISPHRGGILTELIDDTERIVLSHNQNTIGLRFEHVSFIAEGNVKFSYRLTRVDEDGEWTDIGTYNSVKFSDLPAGHYVFELASTNFDGFRSKEPRRIEIVVKKSPWLSWYAILLYLVTVASVVYMGIRFIMRRRMREVELQVTRQELERVTRPFSSGLENASMSEETPASGGDIALQPALSSEDQAFIDNLKKYIEAHLTGTPISIVTLSEELCMSRASLFRKMKSLTGMTPNDFILSYRLDKAAAMLKEGKWRVNEISDMLGFSSSSYFSKVFKQKFGVTPKEWR